MTIRNKLLALMLFASCSTHLNDQDYTRYVKDGDKGLRKAITVEQMVYDVQYLPERMILLQEHQTEEAAQQRMEQLKHTMWFTISLNCLNSSVNPLKSKVSGIEEYNARLDYFLNHAQEDISLDYGGKKIQPMSYHFENNYGLTSNETIMVGFEIADEKSKQDATLVFEDRVFRNGIIKAFFAADKLIKANKI